LEIYKATFYAKIIIYERTEDHFSGVVLMQMIDVDYIGPLSCITKIEQKNRTWKAAALLVLLTLGVSLTSNVTAQQKPQDSFAGVPTKFQSCPVTKPNGNIAPGSDHQGQWYGDGDM
jgi:hypothetical protein